MSNEEFSTTVWEYYRLHKRSFPWRETQDPYAILVSEIMLQQTQTARVVPKYSAWLEKFPTITALASASLSEVLTAWQGLGYNKRGKNLKGAAEVMERDHKGSVPREKKNLLSLPGVGPYTAGAVRAFAWNEPEIIIETNIRSVFIHHFFPEHGDIHDKELLPLIEATLDTSRAREWYWALMDYGAHLKTIHPNPNRKSSHYSRQSAFKGSKRELRANILRYILRKKHASLADLEDHFQSSSWDTTKVLHDLTDEGMLQRKGDVFFVA